MESAAGPKEPQSAAASAGRAIGADVALWPGVHDLAAIPGAWAPCKHTWLRPQWGERVAVRLGRLQAASAALIRLQFGPVDAPFCCLWPCCGQPAAAPSCEEQRKLHLPAI